VRDNLDTTAGQIYNVGGGAPNSVSLLEVMDEIEAVTGKKVHFKLQRPRPGDQLFYITDFQKLRKHTGWYPQVDLRETVQIICDWWKERRTIVEPISIGSTVPAPILAQVPEAAQ
jgi:CDP-paratose 2-epimerase